MYRPVMQTRRISSSVTPLAASKEQLIAAAERLGLKADEKASEAQLNKSIRQALEDRFGAQSPLLAQLFGEKTPHSSPTAKGPGISATCPEPFNTVNHSFVEKPVQGLWVRLLKQQEENPLFADFHADIAALREQLKKSKGSHKLDVLGKKDFGQDPSKYFSEAHKLLQSILSERQKTFGNVDFSADVAKGKLGKGADAKQASAEFAQFGRKTFDFPLEQELAAIEQEEAEFSAWWSNFQKEVKEGQAAYQRKLQQIRDDAPAEHQAIVDEIAEGFQRVGAE